MPTTKTLASPQPCDAPSAPVAATSVVIAIASPIARREDEAPDTIPDSDDRWADMPCTD
jgi:hypothetical protein